MVTGGYQWDGTEAAYPWLLMAISGYLWSGVSACNGL